ncbi:hypothetical protein JJJ17_11315 [Paracoccus caeni]|uniref:Uncharacterized protein n=1 Tax=Paracoccus caeni TaxID=657651 RepID=A0A934SCT8_9RHOB|nr:hypothetical protein [Paracoccus caeni]MBK4216515.1 hypothetical protein [Paracoccus caeni]
MRWLLRKLLWLVAGLVALILCLLAPAGYVELACRPDMRADDYRPILPETDRRPEARTLLTYPEWHIVHAYDDYARVITTGDPQDYGYLSSIGGFWSSLCALSEATGDHGGFPWETKQMVYTIGVSFTAEMLMKAAYEETLGRVATWIRGDTRAPLDDLSALQAADYAEFLQQVPWYKWDFAKSAAELHETGGRGFRDRERRLALGLEYRGKAAYAGVIAQAVAQVGADALTLRMIVAGIDAERLAALPGVNVIGQRPEGIEIETPRYRELTHLLAQMAAEGAGFVEIAGNDDILVTAISGQEQATGAIFSFRRQGYGDFRHLIMVKVADLGSLLREMSGEGLTLEHVHDY